MWLVVLTECFKKIWWCRKKSFMLTRNMKSSAQIYSIRLVVIEKSALKSHLSFQKCWYWRNTSGASGVFITKCRQINLWQEIFTFTSIFPSKCSPELLDSRQKKFVFKTDVNSVNINHLQKWMSRSCKGWQRVKVTKALLLLFIYYIVINVLPLKNST